MTVAQARKLCEQAGAPLPAGIEKMSAEKVKGTRRKVLDGIEFRSTLEADVYALLKSWERLGAISGLELQPRFLLQAKMRREGKAIRQIEYVADFRFQRGGQTVVIDAKGFRTDVYRIKAKMFRALYPQLVFQEWTREILKNNGG